MCGIAGYFGWRQARTRQELHNAGARMAHTLAHRGPDDYGVWVDAEAGVVLAHRRLAVLDLSQEGHQPMVSASGRFVVTFNGEIYNFREIRDEVGRGFRGSSDTEVMLAAFERWGVAESLTRFNGMFALAVWDRHERSLSLARDRMGEKPLYYASTPRAFLFGSELKALRAHPAFSASIDRGSLALFLRCGYVPAPYSIYEGVRKLAPGTLLTIEDSGRERTSAYWSVRQAADYGTAHPLNLTEQEAYERLEALLTDSVRQRMISDVPLGAFLSGGIDSSLVTALMQQRSSKPVKTFTIGFHEAAYNEADQAKFVARHLACDHTEFYVTAADATAIVPSLPALYDEPFADSSQIPTVMISRLARRSVTVTLSGDGGDESFGGYTRYWWTQRIWRAFGGMSPGLRRGLAGLLSLGGRSDKLHKLALLLPARDRKSLYASLLSNWNDALSLVLHGSEHPGLLTQLDQWPEYPDFFQTMMFVDTAAYLPDDVLVKLDRATMSVGLEARAPLLDHRLVEFAWRLPMRMKVRGGQGKWLLRRVAAKYVPRAVLNRPKRGFGIPIHEWLRGSLRSWAGDLLDPARLRREQFIDPGPIERRLAEHLAGRRNWGFSLWNVLIFEAWLQEQSQPHHAPQFETATFHARA